MNIAIWPADEGGLRRLAAAQRLWCAAALLASLSGCDGAPSRNILGSYFPTWMVCALLGIVSVIVIRAVLVKTGVDAALPAPVVVYLSLWTAATLAIWLVWLG